MKFAAFAFLLFALTGCTTADDQRTKEQAQHDGAVIKHDAREALHEAKVDTEKAGKELNKGLLETRDKVRKAIDAPPDDKDHK